MRLMLVLGLIGGLIWIAYAVVPAECAPPSGATEVFCNRLWTPALLAMAAGFLGVQRRASTLRSAGANVGLLLVAAGAGAMTLGNFAEYWLFASWPHEGPDGWLRGMLWMLVLAGWLLVLVASIVTGLLLFRRGSASRGSRGLAAVLAIVPLTTLSVGVLGIGILAVGASLASLGPLGTPGPAFDPARR